MNTADDPHQVAAWLASKKLKAGAVVAVDGSCGSGKTYLAMQAARLIGGFRVSTDCYLDPEAEGQYIDRLRLEFLTDDLSRLQSLFPIVLLDGICIQDVLGRIGQRHAAAVYVKLTSQAGVWNFGEDLRKFVAGELPLDEQAEPDLSDLSYHARVQPHTSAGLIYARVE